MSYEDATRREIGALEELQKAVTARGHVNATAAIFSDHKEPYEAAVERLLAAVQAYEAAASDVLAARSSRP